MSRRLPDPAPASPLQDPRPQLALSRVEVGAHASVHERVTHEAIARRLADLLGCRYVEHADPVPEAATGVYWVPNDTIVGAEVPRALGIRDKKDLFGGVVPQAFIATKAISHPLPGPDSVAPPGWSHEFPRQSAAATLDGYTTFDPGDARRAGRRLLAGGAVRLKPVSGTGGRGQIVVTDTLALDAAIDSLIDTAPGTDWLACGLVLERDLADAVTFSVGQVEVGGLVATYCGTQRETVDNRGERGYGGSTLLVARGGFEALDALPLSDAARSAVAAACVYDAAAQACFEGFFASRRNYDVVGGRDARGRRGGGVLEQSWRIGGATPAEVLALQALHADPSRAWVRTGCVERFGQGLDPPPGVAVLFAGEDPQAGPLLKYGWIDDDPGADRAA